MHAIIFYKIENFHTNRLHLGTGTETQINSDIGFLFVKFCLEMLNVS